MITIKEVTKDFGATRALDRFSLEIEAGSILGLLGPNGAGKTTLMRMIAGYLRPTSGAIEIDGTAIKGTNRDISRRIGYLPENNPLYDEMLVEEYLGFVTQLRSMDKTEAVTAIKRVVKETALEEVYYKSIDSLSKGYRQRLGIAQAIIHQPDILILDEPTEGLDPNQRIDIRNLIKRLSHDSTVIVSTHVLGEVSATCDRLAIINKGALVAEGGTEELLKQSQGRQTVIIEIEGDDVIEKLEKLEEATISDSEETNGRQRVTMMSAGEQDLRPLIFKHAAANELVIYEMHSKEVSLEEIFRKLTLENPDA